MKQINSSKENKELDDKTGNEKDNKNAISSSGTYGEKENGNLKKDYIPGDTPGESITEVNSLAGGNHETNIQM